MKKETFTYGYDNSVISKCNDKYIKSFKNNKNINIIESFAFDDCKNLKKVTLENSVYVEEFAFSRALY